MTCLNNISVCSRDSKLALAQVEEVLYELKQYYPSVSFDVRYLKTQGDLNLSVSLRNLEKTDFFTKELDELILSKTCRIAIHSAKDLPKPLKEGLQLICLTKGLDPSDSLVLKHTLSVEEFSSCTPLVATSSEKRESAVLSLFPNCRFCDLRGTIEERLAKLERGEAQGVVVAEAALIRLKLTHLPRIRLQAPTTEHQGRLAIIARCDDEEMVEFFKPIHSDNLS